MNGRQKCELINQIRKKIADKNNIDFVIYKCTFEGNCSGTCPKSDSELKYLEGELEKIQSDGGKINLEGVLKADAPDVKAVDDILERSEKLEKILENPQLNNLPPRYLDSLL